jgi:flap endonuclease-1
MQKDIKPVFVFDGKPSELKTETLKKRKALRTDAEEKHKQALEKGDLESARKFGSRALRLTPDMIVEAKKLIKLMGLPFIEAPSEGESQIALLVSKGELFGCVSQDFDSLLFGAEKVLRNITVSGKRKLPGKNIYIDVEPELLDLQKNLEKLKIDRRKLVWLGILIGTDFNDKFPKVGPKTGLKLVQEHNSFEEIIKATGFEPEFDYREIEKIFLEPHVTKDYSFEFKLPEHEKIKSFLCDEHSFSAERVENALKRLEQKLQEKGEQSKLSKWFS